MTTITIKQEVKDLLDFLKIHPREPYNDVVRRLAERAIDFEPLSEEDMLAIDEGLKDIAMGRTITSDQMWAHLEKRKKLKN